MIPLPESWFWRLTRRERGMMAVLVGVATAAGLAQLAGLLPDAEPLGRAWVQYIVYAVILIVGYFAAKSAMGKIKGSEAQKAEVPTTVDGARVRRYYGTVWISDPTTLAMRQVEPSDPIKKKG